MGGIIGLTVRYSDGAEYRGSCWTNIIPDGLCATEFYIDPAESEKYVKKWLGMILKARAKDPELEQIWGGHNMLAPVEYGVVVVDFMTRSVLSHNGYCSILRRYYSDNFDREDKEKYKELKRRGFAILDEERSRLMPGLRYYNIINSFWDVDETSNEANEDSLAWILARFELTAKERRAWEEWFNERET